MLGDIAWKSNETCGRPQLVSAIHSVIPKRAGLSPGVRVSGHTSGALRGRPDSESRQEAGPGKSTVGGGLVLRWRAKNRHESLPEDGPFTANGPASHDARRGRCILHRGSPPGGSHGLAAPSAGGEPRGGRAARLPSP